MESSKTKKEKKNTFLSFLLSNWSDIIAVIMIIGGLASIVMALPDRWSGIGLGIGLLIGGVGFTKLFKV